jgi:hypothetical protein
MPLLPHVFVVLTISPCLAYSIPQPPSPPCARGLPTPPRTYPAPLSPPAHTTHPPAQIARVLDDPSVWLRLSSASSAHWHTLLAADRDASDVRRVMQIACAVRFSPDEARPLALPHAPRGAGHKLLSDIPLARPRARSHCFHGLASVANAGLAPVANPGLAPAVLVAIHGASAGEGPALWVHELWEAICRHCELRCFHGSGGKRPRHNWDVIIEHELTLEPARLALAAAAAAAAVAPRPFRIVHMASSQWHASLRFFERGSSLASTVMSESSHAQLPAKLSAAGLPSDTVLWRSHLKPLRNGSSVAPGVGDMLRFLGVGAPDLDRLTEAAEATYSRFVKHETSPQWLGCFQDSAEDRDLPNGPRTFGHTSQSCAAACTGYPYLGLQGGGQCFCGRAYGSGSNHSRVSENRCGHTCPGEEGKSPLRWCGGGWRNAIYAQARGSSAAGIDR